jgi:predicted nucleic acid-binding protein
MKTVYFDTCSLQRLLDDKTQLRIALEAEAIAAVLSLCEQEQLGLVSSAVLQFEVRRNPHPQRRAFVEGILAQHRRYIPINTAIQQQARLFEKSGFKPIDALHLASAQHDQIDYFCTCDDRFLRKAKASIKGTTVVLSPLELAQEVIQ